MKQSPGIVVWYNVDLAVTWIVRPEWTLALFLYSQDLNVTLSQDRISCGNFNSPVPTLWGSLLQCDISSSVWGVGSWDSWTVQGVPHRLESWRAVDTAGSWPSFPFLSFTWWDAIYLPFEGRFTLFNTGFNIYSSLLKVPPLQPLD